MENEKTDNLQNTPELPNTWRVLILSCVLFVVIFCLFILANFVNVFMLGEAISSFFSDSNQIGVDDLGGGIVAAGGAMLIFISILFFVFPLSLYLSFYSTKHLLHKWYNKMPIFQTGKLLFPAFILFIMVFFVNNMIWNLIIYTGLPLFWKNITSLPFFIFSGYVELFIFGLSIYISKKIIKKLTKGISHE